jgi:hypothetical protein
LGHSRLPSRWRLRWRCRRCRPSRARSTDGLRRWMGMGSGVGRGGSGGGIGRKYGASRFLLLLLLPTSSFIPLLIVVSKEPSLTALLSAFSTSCPGRLPTRLPLPTYLLFPLEEAHRPPPSVFDLFRRRLRLGRRHHPAAGNSGRWKLAQQQRSERRQYARCRRRRCAVFFEVG